MLTRSEALLCASRPHGEHGAVARLFTPAHGLVAGYVAGARGRTLRPLLIPGNRLDVEIVDRGDGRLPSLRLELLESRGPWLGESLASAGIGWATTLVAAALPEGHPYPALHAAFAALLDAICHAPSARGWARALAAFEALLLREVGYGAGKVPPQEDWPALLERLERQGTALAAHLLADHRGDAMGSRAILIDRLRRIAGS